MSDFKLDPNEQAILLQWARDTIVGLLQGQTTPAPRASGALSQPAGAFVTLHKQGMLRGCIGTFSASVPLVETVREMALSASQKDPRFPPVSLSEMRDIDIEISVLSPLKKISDPQSVEVGRHGVYITKGFFSGVLLPQVASEQGWDRDTFLSYTCLKAGIPEDSWKDPSVTIEVFEAQVFGEKNE